MNQRKCYQSVSISAALLILIAVQTATSKNILYVSTLPSPSHHIWNRALALGLMAHGHNVTMLAPDRETTKMPQNYSSIVMEGMYEALHKEMNPNEILQTDTFFGSIQMFKIFSLIICRVVYDTEGLDRLWNYPKDFRFDLIIIDVTAGPCMLPLVQRFGTPPTIDVTAFLLPSYVSHKYGNHLHPSYLPWYGVAYSSSDLSFRDRVWNFLYTYVDLYYVKQMEKTMELMVRDKLKNKGIMEQLMPWDELQRHCALTLANIDPVLNYAQPITPNIIPVGGLQIRPPKPVEPDLQNILDNAKNGFIFFSLGSNVRSDELDESTLNVLLDTFRQMPELILWKFETNFKTTLPQNVVIRKWLSQNDILGHPNIKLFISHGGALSTHETMYHGVPVLVMPFFMDQFVNAKMVVKKGIGLELNIQQITVDSLFSTARELIDNPQYRRNVKKIARVFKDQPQTPLERAIFWIEYVMRHDGDVDFLNTPARDMSLFVSTSADVVIFLFLVLVSVIVVVRILVCSALRRFRYTNKVKTS